VPVFRREGEGSRSIKRTMVPIPSRGRGCACIYSRGNGQSIGPLPSSRPLRDRGFHYLPRQCRNAPSLGAVTSFCRLPICSNEAHPHVDNAQWIELLYRFWPITKSREGTALCLQEQAGSTLVVQTVVLRHVSLTTRSIGHEYEGNPC